MSSPPRRRRPLRAWAVTWTALLVPLFLGVTALTLRLWVTDPQYTETTPVGDLGFLALGAMIALGFASQFRRGVPWIAGPEQSVLAALALAVAGALGGRVEPALGGVVLLLAAVVLVELTPDGFASLRRWRRPDLPAALMVLIAAPPLTVHAATLIGLARDAGPSCFGGQCARGDRFAELAATCAAILALGLLSAVQPAGWRLPAWCAGVAVAVLGLSSLAVPEAPGALGTVGALLALGWGLVFLVVAQRRSAAL